MATRKPFPPNMHDALPGEDEIARLYQAGGNEMPPPALDAHITTEAYRTVTLNKPKRRWAVPLSTAAVVVLAVSVVLLMTKQGALDRDGTLSPVSEYSLPPTEAPPGEPKLADARDAERAAPATAKRAAPEPARPVPASPAVQSTERRLAESGPAEAKAKAEAPAASPPLARGRALEVEHLGKASEESARRSASTLGALVMKTAGAEVTGVAVSGAPGAYTFNITVKSPDTGCQQYADWWEVVSDDGKLLYRRVLLHSHVDEQPFTRSGGPVPIQPDTVAWVRAHMNTSGYGGVAFKGSVKTGFKPAMPAAGFAAGLAKQPPQPEGCDF